MNDGTNGLGLNDTAVLSLLGNVANGGYNRNDGGSYANDPSLQHGLHYNRQAGEDQADCTRGVMQQGLDAILGQFESSERRSQFSNVTDGQFRTELRQSDLAQRQTQLINDNARENDQQHGETKSEIATIKAGQDLLAVKIDANAALAQKNAEIIALQAKLDNRDQTIGNYCCPPPCKPVDPCCGGSSSGSAGDVAAAVVNALAPALNSIASAIAGLSRGPGNSGN